MRIDDFLARLEGVKRSGDGHIARCPAHHDKNPSLSVTGSPAGKVLAKCHAGCANEDIVAAMGLTMADLFNDNGRRTPPSRSSAKKSKPDPPELPPIESRVVEHFHAALSATARDYLQLNRLLSEEVIDRYRIGRVELHGEPRIAIPVYDEDGQCRDVRCWLRPENRNSDSKKVLPLEVGRGESRWFPIDQLEFDSLVAVEGELDALALISAGTPTITATCGASSWPEAASERFRGKVVIILMDHDDAGRGAAQKRAERLAAHGVKVKIASWPDDRDDGWDVTDELRTNGVTSLPQILDAAKPFESEVEMPIGWPSPDPLPPTLPAVELFDPALLPAVFRTWVQDIAERMQTPMDYPAVAAMVTLAVVVGRQVAIRPKRSDSWSVTANLWGAVVGPPGILLKSPALKEPLELLQELEATARTTYEKELLEYTASGLVAEEQKKLQKDEVRRALKEGKKTTAAELARDAVTEDPAPVRRRYICNDTTVEMLGQILAGNPRGVLVFRDELTGLLRSLDREGQEAARSFYLEAWNGDGRFTYDRIGRGTVEIEAACISILGGIQPGPLAQYMRRAAKGGADDDGLLQRFQLVVWPDLPTWENIDRPPDQDASGKAHAVYTRLDNIDLVEIGAETEEGTLPFLRFTLDAQAVFDEYRQDLELRLRGDDDIPAFRSHLAKYRSLIPSLALLIHLADVGTGPVGDAALRRACAWGEYLESHARRYYAPVVFPGMSAAHALAAKLRKGDLESGFTLRDLYRKHWAELGTKEEAQTAVDVLEELGWLRPVVERTDGRWTTRFGVNPKVLEGDRGQVA